jgi:hypothetical protein
MGLKVRISINKSPRIWVNITAQAVEVTITKETKERF